MTNTQLQRIAIIDRTIRNGKPNQKDLHKAIEKELGKVSMSNVDKDLKLMKDTFNAPIVYKPLTYCTGYYLYDDAYDFGDAFILYWSNYVEFSIAINKALI